jgi:primosomal protein N' (replication factor Y)
VERCPVCGSALVLHKAEKGLHCHLCGLKKEYVSDLCAGCGGHNMKLLGTGLERLQEDIKKLFPGFEIKTGRPEAEGSEFLIAGTKKVVKTPEGGSFMVVALVNPETVLFQPRFRAAERLFSEMSHAADKLRPDGVLIVQTDEPAFFKNRIIKDGKLDYEGFMKTELAERKQLGYPPFLKLAVISAERLQTGFEMPSLRGGSSQDRQAVALGPAVFFDRERKKKIHSILVKAPESKTLRAAVSDVLKAMRARLNGATEKIVVDIDPV